MVYGISWTINGVRLYENPPTRKGKDSQSRKQRPGFVWGRRILFFSKERVVQEGDWPSFLLSK